MENEHLDDENSLAEEEFILPINMYIPQLSSFIGNNGFIYLIVCPECFVINSPLAMRHGVCYNCGFNANPRQKNVLL